MACSEGDIHSCHSLGEWWAVVKQQYSKAAAIYKSNCEDHSHGTSCYKLGVLYGTSLCRPFRAWLWSKARRTAFPDNLCCFLLIVASQRTGRCQVQATSR